MKQNRNVKIDGRPKSSVNPQGLTEDVANQRPKSELEDNAKNANTKR
ncbi:small, acid-soluble spore protein L [Aquibacillus salsiterrae]|uniref:Small, acid-soluble spore protein L n=1 Tax=Aquibacillus salsiterrae TaxID=2950439 RepID=A0A9X4AE42_9BACI|nr:small, acid-soluble spore protein L [Aquibacillus salsiterrae]MDC3416261.1 small, acid-soluble spore protein L [Aquibacillus salsiterrae]